MISNASPVTTTGLGQVPLAQTSDYVKDDLRLAPTAICQQPADPRLAETLVVSPEQLAAAGDETGVYCPAVAGDSQLDYASRTSVKLPRRQSMSARELYDPEQGMRYLGMDAAAVKTLDLSASILSPSLDLQEPSTETQSPALARFNSASEKQIDRVMDLSGIFFQYRAGVTLTEAEVGRFNSLGQGVFGDLVSQEGDLATQFKQIEALLGSILVPRVQRKIAAISAVDPLNTAMQNFTVLAVPSSYSSIDGAILHHFPFVFTNQDRSVFGQDFIDNSLVPVLSSVLEQIYYNSSNTVLTEIQDRAATFRNKRDKFSVELQSASPSDENRAILDFYTEFRKVLAAKAQGSSDPAAAEYCRSYTDSYLEALGLKFDSFFDFTKPEVAMASGEDGVASNRTKAFLFIGQGIIEKLETQVVERVAKARTQILRDPKHSELLQEVDTANFPRAMTEAQLAKLQSVYAEHLGEDLFPNPLMKSILLDEFKKELPHTRLAPKVRSYNHEVLANRHRSGSLAGRFVTSVGALVALGLVTIVPSFFGSAERPSSDAQANSMVQVDNTGETGQRLLVTPVIEANHSAAPTLDWSKLQTVNLQKLYSANREVLRGQDRSKLLTANLLKLVDLPISPDKIHVLYAPVSAKDASGKNLRDKPEDFISQLATALAGSDLLEGSSPEDIARTLYEKFIASRKIFTSNGKFPPEGFTPVSIELPSGKSIWVVIVDSDLFAGLLKNPPDPNAIKGLPRGLALLPVAIEFAGGSGYNAPAYEGALSQASPGRGFVSSVHAAVAEANKPADDPKSRVAQLHGN